MTRAWADSGEWPSAQLSRGFWARVRCVIDVSEQFGA